MARRTSVVILAFGIIYLVTQTHAAVANSDLVLTKSQKQAFDKFKERVLPKLTQDYMKQDVYLVRFLRAKDFHVRQAEEMILNDLKWRKQEKMDTIHTENWSDMEEDYPWYIDGYSKNGNPIMTANYDEWDIRKATLSGKLQRLMRWMTYSQEIAARKVREMQKEGKNVTQYDFIINMNNFNINQHGCVACLPIYTNYVSNYELHYPRMADKIILINTPTVFEVVLNLIRPIMSEQTRNALKVYSNNKDEWDSILFKDIDRDQLVATYGGTKVRN